MDDFDSMESGYAYRDCPDCEGSGGEVGSCMGRLIFVTCIHCAGHGIILVDEEEEDE